MCVYWKVGRWKGEGKHGRKSSGQPEAGVSGNCLPGAVCVLFCADEHVCTFGGRSAVNAEELFPQSGGGAGSGCFAFAGGRAVSYPQGKSAVFSDAVNFRHDGSAV